MNKLLMSASLAAVLATAGLAHAATAPTPQASATAGLWGFDLAGRDTTVAPGSDFYQYANGTYLKSLVIPPDRPRYGTFDALRALSETRVHDLFDQASAHPEASADEALVGAFYKAAMDEARADALDAKPLDHDLAAIRAAKTRAGSRLMSSVS